MKIKFSDFVVEGSGSILGTTYAKNKGGAYRKAKSMPTNPNTSFQSGVRARFAASTTQWRLLTEAQRDAWNGAAPLFPVIDSLGVSRLQSGFQLYIRLNTALRNLGASPLTIPPAPSTVFAPTLLTVVADSSSNDITFTTNEGETVNSVLVYATAPMSPGISNFKNKLALVSSNADTVEDEDLSIATTSGYIAKYGAITGNVGKKIGFAFVGVNAGGEQTPFVQFATLVII